MVNRKENHKNFAFIFARGGSKGVERKNIRTFAGKSLLYYTISFIKKINQIDNIFVSTDDEEIANIAKKNDAVLIKRPRDISCDNSSEWIAWKHSVEWVLKNYGKFHKFISLPVTAPLRIKEDVEKCIAAHSDINEFVITITESKHNPWFNLVNENDNGFLKIVNNKKSVFRRQDAPKVFSITPVAYVTTPGYILKNNSMWAGNVFGINVKVENSIDIDDYLDFKIAELLMLERLKLNNFN